MKAWTMSLIDEPARKIFIKQCFSFVSSNCPEPSNRRRKWTFLRNREVSCGLVWIQGIIVNISENRDAAMIDDGSGLANISPLQNAPGYGPWVQTGEYAMIIGEVLSIPPEIKIRPVKLTQMCEPNAELFWILEVIDFWKFMDES